MQVLWAWAMFSINVVWKKNNKRINIIKIYRSKLDVEHYPQKNTAYPFLCRNMRYFSEADFG